MIDLESSIASVSHIITDWAEDELFEYSDAFLAESNQQYSVIKTRIQMAKNAIESHRHRAFESQLTELKRLLRDYLSSISKTLYVDLRYRLQQSATLGELLRTERRAFETNKKIVTLLKGCSKHAVMPNDYIIKCLRKLETTLDAQKDRERRTLIPIYRQTRQSSNYSH